MFAWKNKLDIKSKKKLQEWFAKNSNRKKILYNELIVSRLNKVSLMNSNTFRVNEKFTDSLKLFVSRKLQL